MSIIDIRTPKALTQERTNMKKTLMVVAVFAILVTAPSLFAQSSDPRHSGLETPKSVIPDRRDHPTGSAEKQAAMDAGNRDQSHGSPGPSSYTPPAPVFEPSADHTTTEEVGDLATKFRKIREAREAKAKKESEQKKQ
jgi:hypothetical protein